MAAIHGHVDAEIIIKQENFSVATLQEKLLGQQILELHIHIH